MALPWISADSQSGKYVVHKEATQFLNRLPHNEHIAVIAVVGRARTGKSFLLNKGILKLPKSKKGFQVSPTVNSCTKGLWIYPELRDFRKKDGTVLKAVIVDSEGLSSCDSSTNHDSRVFALTLLLSSFFVYNTRGNIDEAAITDLGVITDIVQSIEKRQSPSSSEQLQMPFLLWVVRDFTLQLKSRKDASVNISEMEYLQQELNPESCGSNKGCRQLIQKYFQKMSCLTLVRPCDREEDLCRLSTLPNTKLRRPFLNGLVTLQRHIGHNLQPKKSHGVGVCGSLLSDLANAYVTTLNAGDFPVLEDTLTLVSESRNRALADKLIEKLKSELSKIQIPVPPKHLILQTGHLRAEIVKDWNTLCLSGGDPSGGRVWVECESRISDTIQSIIGNNTTACAQHNNAVSKRIVDSVLETIQNVDLPCDIASFQSMCESAIVKGKLMYTTNAFPEDGDDRWRHCEAELRDAIDEVKTKNAAVVQKALKEVQNRAREIIDTSEGVESVNGLTDLAEQSCALPTDAVKSCLFDALVDGVRDLLQRSSERAERCSQQLHDSKDIIEEHIENTNRYRKKSEEHYASLMDERRKQSQNQDIIRQLEKRCNKSMLELETMRREREETASNLIDLEAREKNLRDQQEEMLETDRIVHAKNHHLSAQLKDVESELQTKTHDYNQLVEHVQKLAEAAKRAKCSIEEEKEKARKAVELSRQSETKRVKLVTEVNRLKDINRRLEKQKSVTYQNWLRAGSASPPSKRNRKGFSKKYSSGPEHSEHLRNLTSLIQDLEQ